jgi:hypothetical protein
MTFVSGHFTNADKTVSMLVLLPSSIKNKLFYNGWKSAIGNFVYFFISLFTRHLIEEIIYKI